MKPTPEFTRNGNVSHSITWYNSANENYAANESGTELNLRVDVVNGALKGDRVRPNPFYFKRREKWFLKGRWTRHIDFGGYGYDNVYDGCLSPIMGEYVPEGIELPSTAAVTDKAMAKIYDQLRGGNQVLVDALEGAATLRMLKDTFKLHSLMANFFNAILGSKKRVNRNYVMVSDPLTGKKKRRYVPGDEREPLRGLDTPQKRLDYVTGKWLEYRYGWNPLVNSVYDAYENIIEKRSTKPTVLKARASMVEDLAGKVELYDHKGRRRGKASVRVELGYLFLPPEKGIQDWTSLNPASIAWELLPLSFIADWLTNIGQTLQATSDWLMFNGAFQGGYRTVSTLIDAEDIFASHIASGPGAYDKGTTLVASARIYESSLNRVLDSNLPAPGGLRFRNGIGGKQMLDAAGLFHQLIGKNVRRINSL
jgi:hypothetical protein